MPEFFSTPAGIAVFASVIAVVAIVIIELNYRFFFKYTLDFLFSFLLTLICSPVFIILAVISKCRAGKVTEKTPCLGAKGKIIYVRTYAGIKGGAGKFVRIIDVLCGKLSFVGVKLMPLSDGALMDDEMLDRFSSRPGLITHLALYGDESLTYEEMFALDYRYYKKRQLFRDILIVLKCAVYAIRGERGSYFGEAKDKSYGEVLLERGAVTAEDLKMAEENADAALKESEARRTYGKPRYNG